MKPTSKTSGSHSRKWGTSTCQQSSPSPTKPPIAPISTETKTTSNKSTSSKNSSSVSPPTTTNKTKNNNNSDKENEALLRNSLKNHFKVLALQQDSEEAYQILEVFSDRLQQTRNLLVESQEKLQQKELELKAREEQQQDSNGTRSISPSSPTATATLITSASVEQQIENLNNKMAKLIEKNRILKEQRQFLTNDISDSNEHLRKLLGVVADSRKAIESMAKMNESSSSPSTTKEDNDTVETATKQQQQKVLVSGTDAMRSLYCEVDKLIYSSFASISSLLLSNRNFQNSNRNNLEELKLSSKSPSLSVSSQQNKSNNNNDEENNIPNKSSNNDEEDHHHQVLFQMLRKSQKEVSFYRSQVEELQKKLFSLTSSSSTTSGEKAIDTVVLKETEQDFLEQTKQEFRIRQLEKEKEQLLEQIELWKKEAVESQQEAQEAKNEVLKWKLEAESFKNLCGM